MIIGDILTHQAGLEPWIPFYLKTIEQLFPEDPLYNRDISPDYPFRLSKYAYLNRHIKHKEHVFDINFSPHYPLKVGKNMYLRSDYRDTIYYSIANSETNGREYKYSDLGYYLFYELLDKKYEPTFYEMVDSMFYAPLGSTSLGYLPLNRFDKEQIIPTENDLIFRKQLVQGTVHDPGAAMMGGICGHAGLFSNANDLAKIMQMYLWKGSYGGEKYFESQTLETFTSCPNCNEGNRRGYGFDKPKLPNHRYGPSCDQASPSSYGHSGFTGTLTWVDPETGLLFIFLSNRIHPDASNTKLISEDIRTRIQEVFYKAVE
jgi:CubicO group peptidase (beta-lactamase class C family)